MEGFDNHDKRDAQIIAAILGTLWILGVIAACFCAWYFASFLQAVLSKN